MRVDANVAKCVLLVDDDAAVRSLGKRVLESAGYRVLVASHPSDALLLLEEHGPADLLVTDAVMPEFSGRRLAEIVREKNPKVKVLFISGYAHGLAAHGIDNHFLQKPIPIALLNVKVREILDSPLRS